RRPDLQHADGRRGRAASRLHRRQRAAGVQPRRMIRPVDAVFRWRRLQPVQPNQDVAMKTLPLAFAVAATVAMAACATTTSPTGRTQYVGAVSQEQLNQLGAQAFTEQKAQMKQTANATQKRYVDCVVRAVVAQLPASQRQIAWESAVFVDDNPNAFALPGGKVGVYTGIFSVAKNQDQLAAVIAHEVGHVIANHHDERITRQMGAQGALGVVGALVGSRYGEGATQTTNQLGGAALQTAFL